MRRNFIFSDSAGNSSSGNLIFDNGQLYVKIVTSEPVSAVFPKCGLYYEPESGSACTGSYGNANADASESADQPDWRIFLSGKQQQVSDR